MFSKAIIQNDIFEGRYRTTDLDSVSQALLGLGKYGKLNAGTSDISSLSVEKQMRYVRRDSELAMLLAQYNNCLALSIMKIFAGYAKMDYMWPTILKLVNGMLTDTERCWSLVNVLFSILQTTS